MGEDHDNANERFMEALRAEHPSAGAMPADVQAAARAAYEMRSADTLLADVSDDSLEQPLLGVRDAADLAGPPRYLGFHAPGVAIGIEVTAHGGYRDIVGQVSPPQASSAEVRCPTTTSHHVIDPDGVFVARNIPTGPISVVFHRTGQNAVSTRWVAI